MRFASNLLQVADHFGTSNVVVKRWRDVDECPFLIERPYDLVAIEKWLDDMVDLERETNSSLDKEKLKAEIEELNNKNAVFTKDKTFWLAAAALGLTLSREVRDWLDCSESQVAKRVVQCRIPRAFSPKGMKINLREIAKELNLSLPRVVGMIYLHAIQNKALYKGSLIEPNPVGVNIL